jgi:hypothetical protein
MKHASFEGAPCSWQLCSWWVPTWHAMCIACCCSTSWSSMCATCCTGMPGLCYCLAAWTLDALIHLRCISRQIASIQALLLAFAVLCHMTVILVILVADIRKQFFIAPVDSAMYVFREPPSPNTFFSWCFGSTIYSQQNTFLHHLTAAYGPRLVQSRILRPYIMHNSMQLRQLSQGTSRLAGSAARRASTSRRSVQVRAG